LLSGSFAVGATGISLQLLRVRMRLAVAGIRYFAVLVGGRAFAEVPVKRQTDDNGDHEAEIQQERHGHPVEPHCVLHLPREPTQHAEHRAVAPHELRIRVTGDAVRLVRSFAG